MLSGFIYQTPFPLFHLQRLLFFYCRLFLYFGFPYFAWVTFLHKHFFRFAINNIDVTISDQNVIEKDWFLGEKIIHCDLNQIKEIVNFSVYLT